MGAAREGDIFKELFFGSVVMLGFWENKWIMSPVVWNHFEDDILQLENWSRLCHAGSRRFSKPSSRELCHFCILFKIVRLARTVFFVAKSYFQIVSPLQHGVGREYIAEDTAQLERGYVCFLPPATSPSYFSTLAEFPDVYLQWGNANLEQCQGRLVEGK